MNGFRQRKKRRRKDPTRNAHLQRGAQVTVAEVKAHALEGHITCRGTGMTYSLDRGRAEPCRCATRRFLEAHPEVIVDRTGRAWWPLDKPPVAA